MSDVQLLVTVDDEHIERLPEVVEKLKAAGMNVESLMDRIGVVAGSCDSQKLGDFLVLKVFPMLNQKGNSKFQNWICNKEVGYFCWVLSYLITASLNNQAIANQLEALLTPAISAQQGYYRQLGFVFAD